MIRNACATQKRLLPKGTTAQKITTQRDYYPKATKGTSILAKGIKVEFQSKSSWKNKPKDFRMMYVWPWRCCVYGFFLQKSAYKIKILDRLWQWIADFTLSKQSRSPKKKSLRHTQKKGSLASFTMSVTEPNFFTKTRFIMSRILQ